MLSQWLFIGFSYILRLQYHVVVGDITDISDVPNASILNVELCKEASFSVLIKSSFGKQSWGEEGRILMSLGNLYIHRNSTTLLNSTLKMEATCTSEGSVTSPKCTWNQRQYFWI
jgi:hypothetical protein